MHTRSMVTGLAAPLVGAGRLLIAVAAALLPARYWQRLYRLPVEALALPSAVATTLAGLVTGGRGFMTYATRAADAAARLTLDAAARQAGTPAGAEPVTTLAPQLLSIASVAAFMLFTPLGLLATYLTASGLARAAGALTGDAFGDPILTGLDSMARSALVRARASMASRRRANEEGPEAADRLFSGEDAGLHGVDYAVVASRRKPDWSAGAIVVTSEGWFRLGKPFDVRLPFGLRTVYPLTRLETAEVLRRAVRYELPTLQRGPGMLRRR